MEPLTTDHELSTTVYDRNGQISWMGSMLKRQGSNANSVLGTVESLERSHRTEYSARSMIDNVVFILWVNHPRIFNTIIDVIAAARAIRDGFDCRSPREPLKIIEEHRNPFQVHLGFPTRIEREQVQIDFVLE